MFGHDKITKTVQIEGMSCSHCAKKVEMALKELQGVKSVKVVLEDKKAEIVSNKEIDDETIKRVIEEIGYHVSNG